MPKRRRPARSANSLSHPQNHSAPRIPSDSRRSVQVCPDFQRRGAHEIDDETSALYTTEDNLAGSLDTICALTHDLRESVHGTPSNRRDIYTDKYEKFKEMAGEGDGITHVIFLHQKLMDVLEGVVTNDSQQALRFRYLCGRRLFGLGAGRC